MTEGRKIADWENAKETFPSTVEAGVAEWVDLFDRRPDVMHQILGDIYRVYKADQRKRAGEYTGGRRPSTIDGNLAELWAITTPQYSMDEFPIALRNLMNGHSLRQFASRVPMDHRELSRMMRGVSRLDPFWLAQIARTAGVNPAYFREYRAQVVTGVLAQVFDVRPNLSVMAVKWLSRELAVRP